MLIGQAISDWTNPGSALRAQWRHWRRCFDVEAHYNASEARNNRTYLNVRVRLTFVRYLENAALFLKVYEVGREPRPLFTHTIIKETNVMVGEQRAYTLAVIPIEPGENAYWGSPENPTAHFLSAGGIYIASVCLQTKKHCQEHKIYVEIPSQTGGNFGRIFVLDERYAILDWLRKPTLDAPSS